MTLLRLVHTLNRLPAAQAADLLAGMPAGRAARALARTKPHHGMLIVGALGALRVEQLIAALQANSKPERQLRICLVDGWRMGRFADSSEDLDRMKSAADELKERLQRNPDEVRGWYRLG